MFKNPLAHEDHNLQSAIDSSFEDLQNYPADSDEAKQITQQLTALYALKNNPVPLDPNKLLLIAANIFIGVRVLKFEETGVVATKLWSFLAKP